MKKIVLFSLLVTIVFELSAQTGSRIIPIARQTSAGIEDFFDPSLKPFYHGVASGDPLQDRVIIWTRVTPDEDKTISVDWRVSTSPDMGSIVKSGNVATDMSKDYTVKVDVTGLSPATTYYYEFRALGASSIVGRMRTAPEKGVDQLRFAVVSCSNYQDGYFNAYERISERDDLDAVIHLGDYIYEYESGGYGYSDKIGRGHLPENELYTLSDYRVRYSYYKLDPQLRKAHQQVPFITIWDDHEFANNAWMNGAENHQPNEGDWQTRKANAYQAYFEWMPIRESSVPNRIYRKINYGNLVDLIMLDTRIEGREEQEGILKAEGQEGAQELKTVDDYQQYLHTVLPRSMNEGLSQQEYDYLINTLAKWAADGLSAEEVKAASEYQDVESLVKKSLKAQDKKETSNMKMTGTEAMRQLLGEAQFSWLEDNLKYSGAQWKVIANQVLMMPLKGVPLSDTWDGYTESRDRLLNFIKTHKLQNVVVVTGDIHMTFAGDLPTSLFSYTFNHKNSVAVEFVTPSITAGNLDEFAAVSEGFLTGLLGLFNPHIKNTDLKRHGYMVLSLNQSRAQADWYYVGDIEKITNVQVNGESWYVEKGDTRLQKAPAPFSARVGSYGERAPEKPLLQAEGKTGQSILVIGNYPNPAQGETIIHYALSKKSNVAISVLDGQGKEVKKVIGQIHNPGIYAIQVPVQDLGAGVYLYSVASEGQKVIRKFIVR